MSSVIEERLAQMGVILPPSAPPAANYVPFVKSGKVLYVSGQISSNPGGMIIGKIGAQLNTQEGYDAARTCAINLLAQVKIACDGDLDLLDRVVKLTGFVNSTPDFTEQPTVINGASDFLVEVLGESGRHARSAVSAGALPLGVAVEVEGIFQLK